MGFRVSKVLLVGNCVLDQVYRLPNFPAENEEIRAVESFQELGGNACNSGQILRQLGHEVQLMSALAQDVYSNDIRLLLKHAHINYRLCEFYASGSTPVSTIWLNQQNASRTIVHYRDLAELSLQQLRQIRAKAFDWIHFEGRNIDNLKTVLPEIAGQGTSISLEIEKAREGIEQLIPFADTVVISSHYLKQKNLSPVDALAEFKILNPEVNMVCTLGEKGLIAQYPGSNIIKIRAESIPCPVDTRGAGDCFIAALVSHLVQHYDFETALRFASKLAARKIEVQGMKVGAFAHE